jgi:hypothetical protein
MKTTPCPDPADLVSTHRAMSGGRPPRSDLPPGLLHNIGGPPRASISWRGMPDSTAARGPGPDTSEPERPRGAWLQLSLSIGQRDERYRRDWNTASALLGVMEPEHGLSVAAAHERLVELIEAHTQRLAWPPVLLADSGRNGTGRSSGHAVTVDHALTTFVALAKCTGSLWMRGRRPHLAPLHAPTLIEPGSTPMRGVRWGVRLWFAQGIPQELLAQLGAGAAGKPSW